jgi:hypothetical protein
MEHFHNIGERLEYDGVIYIVEAVERNDYYEQIVALRREDGKEDYLTHFWHGYAGFAKVRE